MGAQQEISRRGFLVKAGLIGGGVAAFGYGAVDMGAALSTIQAIVDQRVFRPATQGELMQADTEKKIGREILNTAYKEGKLDEAHALRDGFAQAAYTEAIRTFRRNHPSQKQIEEITEKVSAEVLGENISMNPLNRGTRNVVLLATGVGAFLFGLLKKVR